MGTTALASRVRSFRRKTSGNRLRALARALSSTVDPVLELDSLRTAEETASSSSVDNGIIRRSGRSTLIARDCSSLRILGGRHPLELGSNVVLTEEASGPPLSRPRVRSRSCPTSTGTIAQGLSIRASTHYAATARQARLGTDKGYRCRFVDNALERGVAVYVLVLRAAIVLLGRTPGSGGRHTETPLSRFFVGLSSPTPRSRDAFSVSVVHCPLRLDVPEDSDEHLPSPKGRPKISSSISLSISRARVTCHRRREGWVDHIRREGQRGRATRSTSCDRCSRMLATSDLVLVVVMLAEIHLRVPSPSRVPTTP